MSHPKNDLGVVVSIYSAGERVRLSCGVLISTIYNYLYTFNTNRRSRPLTKEARELGIRIVRTISLAIARKDQTWRMSTILRYAYRDCPSVLEQIY